MQILVDETIARRTVVRRRELGHDVLDIRGTSREGMKDELLWKLAQSEKRGTPPTARRAHRPSQGQNATIHAQVMQTLGQFNPEEWRELLAAARDTFKSIRRPKAREEKTDKQFTVTDVQDSFAISAL